MMRERIQSVELKEIRHEFETGESLFGGMNLKLPLAGEMLALQGPPGSGRSLLLKILAGLLEPSHGEVLYNGQSIHQMSFEEFVPLRLSTAFGFEDGGLLMNKTLEENLILGLLYHRGWRAERQQVKLDELVEHFELKPFLHLRPAHLSSSVKKMAGLVRAFLHNPQILFLDEPSLGLGEKALEALHFYLEKHRREGKKDELVVIATSDETFLKKQGAENVFRLTGKAA